MEQRRRVALVTGAGRNIGRAVAVGLAEDGLDIVLNGSRDRVACEAVAAEVAAAGGRAAIVMGDVGAADSCARIAAEAIAAFGGVDVLVNNAAIRPGKAFLDSTDAEWQRVLDVDLGAAVWLSRACLPGMIERGWGRVVNFAGMNAIQGYGGRAAVSVAKHAAWGLTKALAKEFGPQGITANIVSPGPIAADEAGQADAAHQQATLSRVPAGRLGTSVEVAAMVRMLVSERGAYVNGQLLQVNGGGQM